MASSSSKVCSELCPNSKGRSSKKKSVSILLNNGKDLSIMEQTEDLDACLFNYENSALRRASDEYPYSASASPGLRSNLLEVINVIDNPLLYSREASDGLLALRADRERQRRRHSMCPESQHLLNGSKSITTNVKYERRNFSIAEVARLRL